MQVFFINTFNIIQSTKNEALQCARTNDNYLSNGLVCPVFLNFSLISRFYVRSFNFWISSSRNFILSFRSGFLESLLL